MSAGYVAICRLDEIPRLGARRVRRADGVEIAVFRTADDRVFALRDRCPHKGGPLSQGLVFGTRVACPLHNWTIALDTGCADAPDVGCAPRFAVAVVDGIVHLAVAAAVGAAEVATAGAPAGPPESAPP